MISVLIPSRNRLTMLEENTKRLLDLAANPENMEILVVADPDDPATIAFSPDYPCPVHVFTVSERLGYAGLHTYYNTLAEKAAGDWLMIYGDDVQMRTEGWDEIIEDHMPNLLFMGHNDHSWANVFPIVPRSWYETLGHLSLLPPVDSWVQDIAEKMGRQVKIPVQVVHDAPHLTGRAADQTYNESRRSYMEEFIAMQNVRDAEVEKIKAAKV